MIIFARSPKVSFSVLIFPKAVSYPSTEFLAIFRQSFMKKKRKKIFKLGGGNSVLLLVTV